MSQLLRNLASHKPFLFSAGILLMGCFLFWHVSVDDAFISYRYAQHLSHGNGLVFNIGEKEEGYSNLLWVLLLAGADRIGINVIIASKLTGLASALLLLYCIARSLERFSVNAFIQYGVLAICASMASMWYWSMAGLETMAYVAVLYAGFYILATSRYWYRSAILFSLLPLLRPEGFVYMFLGIAVAFFLRNRNTWSIRKLLYWGLVAVTPFLILLAFRKIYYGLWSSLPAIAKSVAFGAHGEKAGVLYIENWVQDYPFLAFSFLIVLASPLLYKKYFSKDTRFYVVIGCIAVVFMQLIFAITVGGDWMLFGRFILPAVPFLITALGISLEPMSILMAGIIIIGSISVSIHTIPSNLYIASTYQTPVSTGYFASCLAQTAGYSPRVSMEFLGLFGYFSNFFLIDDHGLIDRQIAYFNARSYPGDTNEQRTDRSKLVLQKNPDYLIAPLYSSSSHPEAEVRKVLAEHRIPRASFKDPSQWVYVGTVFGPERRADFSQARVHLMVFRKNTLPADTAWRQCINSTNDIYYLHQQNGTSLLHDVWIARKSSLHILGLNL